MSRGRSQSALVRPGGSRAGLIGRQPQPLPDQLLDHLLVRRGLDDHDVLLAPEQGEHRIGLLVVVAEPDGERLLGVVLPGDQGATARVALALDRRAALDEVVVHAAAGAEPPGEHPAADLGVGQIEMDDAVDVVALQEKLGLPRVAREPVDDEPGAPDIGGEPPPRPPRGRRPPARSARRHSAPYLGTHLRMTLHVPAEDVADVDVRQVQIFREHGRLRALAAARDAHEDVFPHADTLTYPLRPRTARIMPRAGGPARWWL